MRTLGFFVGSSASGVGQVLLLQGLGPPGGWELYFGGSFLSEPPPSSCHQHPRNLELRCCRPLRSAHNQQHTQRVQQSMQSHHMPKYIPHDYMDSLGQEPNPLMGFMQNFQPSRSESTLWRLPPWLQKPKQKSSGLPVF